MTPANSGQRVTMRDIARKLNVSQPTISRALRNDSNVSKKLAAKIQKTAQAMGYHPDPFLSALNSYRFQHSSKPITAELAWINCWNDPKQLRSHKDFDLYWQGAHDEAERAGYRLEEFFCNDRSPASRLMTILHARNIKGLLIPPFYAGVDWTGLEWKRFSIVRCGWGEELPRTHRVACNPWEIGRTLFEAAKKRGYQRIGYATFCHLQDLPRRFIGGYLYAQSRIPRTAQIPPLVFLKWGQYDVTRQQLKRWIDTHKVDAILTDVTFVKPLLHDIGVKVPDDVGVAHISVTEGCTNAGIDQNSEQIGRAAIQTLISFINHQECGLPTVQREVLVEGTWVDGPDMPDRNRS